MALVLPPWGWSIGFIATPRTTDLKPKLTRYPALAFLKRFLAGSATRPWDPIECTEKIFLTPEGNLIKLR